MSAVEICVECDIADCHHIRARRAAAAHHKEPRMTEELSGGCLDERAYPPLPEAANSVYAQSAYWPSSSMLLKAEVIGAKFYSEAQMRAYVDADRALRASLSTSKQAGAEPVDWSKMEALGWQRINCPVCGDMARAAPGATIAAREQEALPEPVMLSLFEGGEKTWPHYFDLKVGQRVRVHTGEEGTIACLLRRTKKYHVLFRPDYGGTYGAWEVTPLASREEAPATPTAEPVTDAKIAQWAERHDIQGGLEELRAMVGDARTLENADVATPPATSADADYLEFGATPFPARKNPCKDCGGSGMDGDVGEQGQAITIDCSACHGSGEQTAKLPWPWENEAQLLHDAITYLEHQPRIADALGIMRAALTQPTTVQPLKDHEIAKLVNDLRDVAKEFHDHQSLRERIAYLVLPLAKPTTALNGGNGEGES